MTAVFEVKVASLDDAIEFISAHSEWHVVEHGGHFIQASLFGCHVVFVQTDKAMHGYQVVEVDKNQLAQIKLLFLKKSLAFSEAMYHDDTSYSYRLKYTHRDLFFVEFVSHDTKPVGG